MKAFWLIFGVLAALHLHAQLPGVFAPEIVKHLEENRHILRGGSAAFDDCAIAVGSAAVRAGGETVARSIAHANARAELAALLNGVNVSATETLNESTVSSEDTASHNTTRQTEITTRLDNLRQSRVRIGGEWRSADGKVLFVCLFSLVNDTASSAAPDGPLPDGIQDWKVKEAWESLFRGAPGILKGGATLVCDDYGEQYVLAVGTCPAGKPFSERNRMLEIKAAAAALAYSKGSMLSDMRYLKESLSSSIDEEGDEADDSEIILRHFQTLITIGNHHGFDEEAGNWSIDGGKRACGAFVIRLDGMNEESFDVPLPASEPSDDVFELNLEDSAAAELLRKELAKAAVFENDSEIVLELPESSPVFTQQEREIVIVDHLVMPIVVQPIVKSQQNIIILHQPQRLVSKGRCRPRCSQVVFHRPVVLRNHPCPHRVYMPCRFRRPPHRGRMVHRRPPKPIVIRRGHRPGRPQPHHGSHGCHPPRIRIHHPKPGPRHVPPPHGPSRNAVPPRSKY